MIDDIKIVDSKGSIVEPSAKTDINAVEGSVVSSTGILESTAIRVLGMENTGSTTQYSKELEQLIDYAKAQTGKDELTPDKLAWILRDLDMKIGASPFAEKRIYKLARFVSLNKQKSQIEEELKGYGAY